MTRASMRGRVADTLNSRRIDTMDDGSFTTQTLPPAHRAHSLTPTPSSAWASFVLLMRIDASAVSPRRRAHVPGCARRLTEHNRAVAGAAEGRSASATPLTGMTA